MACGLRTSALILGLVVLGLNQVQAQTRVRGTIAAADGDSIMVDKTPIRLGEKTEIVFAQPITLADLKPGDFLGVTSARQRGGQLIAYEVRRFPKPVNPGHRPFDGRDDQTMTNATVGATVQSANGRELTMTYEGGSQKVVVPPGTPIVAFDPGSRADLKPGETIWTNARREVDGRIVVERLNVSKDGVKPPH